MRTSRRRDHEFRVLLDRFSVALWWLKRIVWGGRGGKGRGQAPFKIFWNDHYCRFLKMFVHLFDVFDYVRKKKTAQATKSGVSNSMRWSNTWTTDFFVSYWYSINRIQCQKYFNIKITVIFHTRRHALLAVLDTRLRWSSVPRTYWVTSNYQPTDISFTTSVRASYLKEAIGNYGTQKAKIYGWEHLEITPWRVN